MDKLVATVVGDAFQVAQIARVGKLVEIDQRARVAPHPPQDEIRSNKSRAAGDQNRIVHEVDRTGSSRVSHLGWIYGTRTRATVHCKQRGDILGTRSVSG